MAMYTSPDEARSDLFLSGAVYVFGGFVIVLLLQILPLQQIRGVPTVLALLLPIVTTVLVPHLLVRYRKESWSDYGLGAPDESFVAGAIAGLPLVIASVLSPLVVGGDPLAGLPIVALGPGALLDLLARLVTWVSLAVLAVYGTVKARDAFRADYATVRESGWQIGRWVLLVLGVSTALLAASFAVRGPTGGALQVLLVGAGAAAVPFLVHRRVPERATTSRATLLTPTVLLALGPFALDFNAAQFVTGVWLAAVSAAIGLSIGMLVETRRSALSAIGLAVVVAALTVIEGGQSL